LEESPQGEVIRKFVTVPYSLTTPAFGHPKKGVELSRYEPVEIPLYSGMTRKE